MQWVEGSGLFPARPGFYPLEPAPVATGQATLMEHPAAGVGRLGDLSAGDSEHECSITQALPHPGQQPPGPSDRQQDVFTSSDD